MNPKPNRTVFRIYPTTQNYAWGGYEFIPKLIGLDVLEEIPVAELWMGDHPKSPSTLDEYFQGKDLRTLIHSDPKYYLGQDQRSGDRLPFLFKVLDVNDMLSIQAHPNKEQAEIGFATEEKLGIDLHAFNRVFKDDNHKPELMVALSEFWLLHGFQNFEKISDWINNIDAFAVLRPKLDFGIKILYEYIMQMEDNIMSDMLINLQADLSKLDVSSKDLPHYWVNKAFDSFGMDRGIISFYLFNLVRLDKGEAIFQDAGIPHAYLEGQNIEIMSNSDNVFRGGLTQKYIDVDLLLKHILFEETTPNILSGLPCPLGKHFPTPIKDFDLYHIHNDRVNFQFSQAAVLLVYEGSGKLSHHIDIDINSGEVYFVLPNTPINLEGDINCYLATSVGSHS